MNVTSLAASTAGAVALAAGAAPDEPAVASQAKRKGAKSPAGSAKGAAGSAKSAAKKSTGAASASAADALANAVLGQIGKKADPAGLVRAVATSVAGLIRGAQVPGYATAQTASKSSDLAFLSDPKLSLEEKLIKLLGVLNARWDKQIQDRLDQIEKGEAAKTTSTSTSTKKSTGILGNVVGALTDAFGSVGNVLKIPAVKTALKKLGGPALAAAASALGFPAAAPVLLKYGPDVVNAAISIASAAGGSTSKTSQATSTGAALNDADRQTIMMEVQNIRGKQQEMFELVSNILKSGHDTRLSIIGNIR